MIAWARAEDYARASRATATRRAYRSDWVHFEAWCRTDGLASLPATPQIVGAYLAAHAAALAPTTLSRRMSSIAVAHRLAGHQLDTRHPTVRDVMAGIRRERGTAPFRAAPATTDIIRRMTAACDVETLIGLRDRALLLVGFAGAFRRSELVGLDRRDLAFGPEGVRITLHRSKEDQEGAGEVVGVARVDGSPTCPVAALEAWLIAGSVPEGAVFRSVDRHGRVAPTALDDRAVARVVQKLAAAVGLNPTIYSGHSLRAGFATSAAAHGIEERRIAKQTRHKSVVVRTYIRDGEVFVHNASSEVGL
ncbi:site-specific integrase [Belnapia sp. T6]|uniref:Site-specific integrase n=1 Tax=Belnapia mucosa TaxID=2804532 RepID=A0ABS1UYI6_9PROT|nr:site-specific integrase [Belnapia mucosa]MBL6454524.1 site-specific integrase [Belnapia mucosa]